MLRRCRRLRRGTRYTGRREWKRPTFASRKDPLAYSRLRRALNVADTARSTAAFFAFAYGPRVNSSTKPRARSRSGPLPPPWPRSQRPARRCSNFRLRISRIWRSSVITASPIKHKPIGSRSTLKAPSSQPSSPRFSRRFSAASYGARRGAGRCSQRLASFHYSSRETSSFRSTSCRSSIDSNRSLVRWKSVSAISPRATAWATRRFCAWI